jgi:hypothetical protein
MSLRAYLSSLIEVLVPIPSRAPTLLRCTHTQAHVRHFEVSKWAGGAEWKVSTEHSRN